VTRFRLICSTGAFTRFPDRADHRTIVEFGPRLDVEGLELVVFPTWNLDVVADDLVKSGLHFPVIHADKTVGIGLGASAVAARVQGAARLVDNVRLAETLGAQLVVVHLWDSPESDANLQRNLETLASCHEAAARAGVALAVETLPSDHSTPLGNIRQVLATDGRLAVALDTEYLALHGELTIALDADWLWENRVVGHIHIKDFDGCLVDANGRRRYLHPGEGNIDFHAVAETLKHRAFSGTVSLESSAVGPCGEVDFGRIDRSLSLLASLARPYAER
jgi:sugar phosphate isomerase/epimerase